MSDCINRTKARTILGYSGATPTASNEYVTKEQCITMGAESSPLGKYKSNKELVNLDDVVKGSISSGIIFKYEPMTDTFTTDSNLVMSYDTNTKKVKKLDFTADNSYFRVISDGAEHLIPANNGIEFDATSIFTPYNFNKDKILLKFTGNFRDDEVNQTFGHFCVYGTTHNLKFGFTHDLKNFNKKFEVNTVNINDNDNVALNIIFSQSSIQVRVRLARDEWNERINVKALSMNYNVSLGATNLNGVGNAVDCFLMTIIEKFQMNWLH